MPADLPAPYREALTLAIAEARWVEGKAEGELKGRRDTLLRLLVRAGLALTDDDRALIQACTSETTLDRWIDNVFGAKSAPDVLS